MMRLSQSVLMLALLLPIGAHAAIEPVTADSKITAVTVYAGRAKVTRAATVHIAAGAQVVTFEGLPASIFPDSLRAEGSAVADVKFGAVTHKQVMSAQLTSQREKELTTQLENLRDQVAAIEAEKQAVQARQNFLSNLGQQAQLRSGEEIAQIDLKPDQWTGAADAIYSGVSGALKAISLLDIKRRELDREVQKTQAELNLMRTDQRSTRARFCPGRHF